MLSRRLLRNFLARCFVCAFSAIPVRVLAEDGDTLDLPAAGVAGRPVDDAPAHVSGFDAEELRRFASLADALGALPGFQVRQEGGLGGYSELSFRGADAGNVEVYIDGLRLNQEGESAPDLAKFPLLWFAALQARSGFDAIGAGDPGSLARVDLSTAGKNPGADFENRMASFSTEEAAATVSGGQAWKWTLGVEGQSSLNDYPYFSDNYTAQNQTDDTLRQMDNNAYSSRGARAALHHEGAANTQSWSLMVLDYTKEYPGLFPENAQAYTRHDEILGGWRCAFYFGETTLETGLQARRFDDDYRDPDQTLGYLSYENARVATAFEGDASLRVPLPARFDLTAETRERYETMDPTAKPFDQAFASPEAERREAGFGLTLHSQWTRSLSVTGEARGDWTVFDAQNAPAFPDSMAPASENRLPLAFRLGGQWKTPFGAWGALGRFEQRAPTALEFLGDNNGIRPDVNLRPEQTVSYELFHAWEEKSLRLQTSLFWNHYLDPIRLEADGSSAFLHYANGSDYRAYGLEAEGGFHRKLFEADASLTLQNLVILSGNAAGNWPAYQSPVESHADLFWKPATSITIGPIFDFHGPYYPGDVNLAGTHRDAEMEWGAEASAHQGPWRLACDARNVTDHHAQDFAYSVRSGRSYSLNLSINL